MTDFDDLIGVPYLEDGRDPRRGLDCWGLVLVVMARLHGRLWHEVPWREIPWADRAFGDIVTLDVLGISGHTGVILDDDRMIHAARGKGVCVERYTGAAWRQRITGVFRHA